MSKEDKYFIVSFITSAISFVLLFICALFFRYAQNIAEGPVPTILLGIGLFAFTIKNIYKIKYLGRLYGDDISLYVLYNILFIMALLTK